MPIINLKQQWYTDNSMDREDLYKVSLFSSQMCWTKYLIYFDHHRYLHHQYYFIHLYDPHMLLLILNVEMQIILSSLFLIE